MEFVNWDDYSQPNISGKIKTDGNQTTNIQYVSNMLKQCSLQCEFLPNTGPIVVTHPQEPRDPHGDMAKHPVDEHRKSSHWIDQPNRSSGTTKNGDMDIHGYTDEL